MTMSSTLLEPSKLTGSNPRLRNLCVRSGCAMLAVCMLIVLLGAVPRSPEAQPEDNLFKSIKDEEGVLRQILVLHRHGTWS